MKLLETIKAVDGRACYLSYHQQRLERAIAELGMQCDYRLGTLLDPPQKGVYRCRVVYDENGIDISYHAYTPRPLHSLRALTCDSIDYACKYADRSAIDALFAMRGACDDIAIVKNGFLTDTSIANIALFDGERWITPKSPLLKGTTRARLLEEKKIEERDIPLEALHLYRRCAVMNAMIGFVEVDNGIIT